MTSSTPILIQGAGRAETNKAPLAGSAAPNAAGPPVSISKGSKVKNEEKPSGKTVRSGRDVAKDASARQGSEEDKRRENGARYLVDVVDKVETLDDVLACKIIPHKRKLAQFGMRMLAAGHACRSDATNSERSLKKVTWDAADVLLLRAANAIVLSRLEGEYEAPYTTVPIWFERRRAIRRDKSGGDGSAEDAAT